MIPVLEDIIRGLLNGTMTPEQAKFYLEQHERLQAEVDALTDVSYARARCLLDTLRKCEEQDQRWGPRQYPSFDETLTVLADTGQFELAGRYGIPNARKARLMTAEANAFERLSWMDILVEEVAKTTEKHEDQVALRAQLIDVAGVAVQWAAQLTPDPVVTIKANTDGTITAEIDVPDHEGPGDDA